MEKLKIIKFRRNGDVNLHGQKLLEVIRLSRRHTYLENGEIRIHRDPIFDEEKRLLMERISRENKRKIAKELGIPVRQLLNYQKKIRAQKLRDRLMVG